MQLSTLNSIDWAWGWILLATWIFLATCLATQIFISIRAGKRAVDLEIAAGFAATTAWLLWLLT